MSTAEYTNETRTDQQVDVTNCDKEPIHIPGSIQPHGVLFALQEPELRILQVSETTQQLLGIDAYTLIDRSLAEVLVPSDLQHLKGYLALDDLRTVNPLRIEVTVANAKRVYDGIVHRVDGVLILELEPAQTDGPMRFPSFYHSVGSSVRRLQEAQSLQALCEAAASEVARITGFDRVMIYRFDKDWNGEVIAEVKRDDMEPYLGLHYPASDIPRQARELYRRKWLRLIADVSYRPSPILPIDNPLTGRPLDLSSSVLRSVSPVHIQYLKNMGVQASMSISLLKENQLWGLISCHHETPKYVSYETRTACEFLGQIFSLQLAAKESYEDYEYELKVKDIQAKLRKELLNADSFLDELVTQAEQLLEMVGANGALLSFGGRLLTVGVTPEEKDCKQLLAWLREHNEDDVFVTDSLATVYPESERIAEAASGLLAISISQLQQDYIVWFRPEVTEIVQWAGNPEKPMETVGNELVLHPRTSFAAWSQTVRLKALPWKDCEVEAARDLRGAIVDRVLRDVILQRADQLARLNEELARSNSELDSFAYSASHDLKEPLRGIHNYALILREEFAQTLGPEGTMRVETLVRLTKRMDELIDSLLHYSRIGRVDLSFADTDLNEIVGQVLDMLSVSLEEAGVQVRIPRPLPTVYCDRVRISEVFSNLITNAIKYTDKAEKWIEIGYLEAQPADDGGQQASPLTFYVRDNGLGIRQKHFEAIFRIFKRLHGRDTYGGGTGAGLAIVKRIIERHGGTIWLESTYGEGTTFYFTLGKEVR